jgi:hypothetical protein
MGWFKKLTKPFKSIAKKIKKTASSVWKGIKKGILKPLGKLYGKTFGKLGPLGMIAASFILPGLGSMMAAGWTSLAGTLGTQAAGGFLNAVSAGMTSISTGLANVGSFAGGISDKIGQVFTKLGGDISTGASNLFQGASDWASTKGVDISKMGDWVANKAQSVGIGGTPQASAETLLQANPELRMAANSTARGQFDAITASQKAQALGIDPTERFAQLKQPQIAEQFAQTPGLAKSTVISTTGEEVASANILGRNMAQRAPAKTSLAKKALKSAASSLLQTGQKPIEVDPVSFAATGSSAFATQRLGIGGTAATGGQFLTPQQQAFFQQHASLLGQQG